MLKCAVANMPDSMLTQMKYQLGLSANSKSRNQEVELVLNSIWEKGSVYTCVGPTSNAYKNKIEYQINDEGNYEPVFIAGNATLCLQDKQCSIEPYFRNTYEKCISVPGQKGGKKWLKKACQLCDSDGYCLSATTYPVCYSQCTDSQCCSQMSIKIV